MRLFKSALLAGSLLAVNTCATGAFAATQDIVDTAKAAGNFTTLVKALQVSGLDKTLKGKGPYTVFAPNDAAFAKLPAEDLNALLADKKKLPAVLKYHVLKNDLPVKEIKKLDLAPTMQGYDLSIHKNGDKVLVDSGEIIKADIKCSNGEIQEIDTVLMPKDW
jgi:uncharacterized surface protein with fasciclin (FAS1) repeats